MVISLSRRIGAWAVHLFTASGAICGLLAMGAIADGRLQFAFGWMFAAVVIDAVDWYLARAIGVESATAGYDGALLDNLVDYLNYAIVPAFFVLRLAVVTPSANSAAAFAIVLAAAYQFAQVNAKTLDHFFQGFPSYWNIAVFYLHYLALGPTANLAIIATLVVATFVPAKWAYPTRMPRLRGVTLLVGLVWGGCVAYVLFVDARPAVLWSSLALVGYYVGVSRYLVRGTTAS
jgi:phosphatidylcholine synthase